MRIAEILSDLTSLRVCGPTEALALVRATPSSAAEEKRPSLSEQEDDAEIRRVYELMELHDLVKRRYGEGRDSDLEKARRDVDALLHSLKEEDDDDDDDD